MPLPKPEKSENRYQFMHRCINNVIVKRDFEDPEQRIAVCSNIWKEETEIK
jgi:hypothetical protein